MKRYLFSIILLCSYALSYGNCGGLALFGNYRPIPFVPYRYVAEYPTGTRAATVFTWKVTNGKIMDGNGEFTLSSTTTDGTYYPVYIKWDGIKGQTTSGLIEVYVDGQFCAWLDVTVEPSDYTVQNVDQSGNLNVSYPYVTLRDVTLGEGSTARINGYFSVDIQSGFWAKEGSDVRIFNEPPGVPLAATYEMESGEETGSRESSFLGANTPNPFTDETAITYFIAASAVSSYIQINGVFGTVVKKIPLIHKGEGTVRVNGKELGAGNYTYSLIVDGKLVDTKQMVVK